jgi:AAA family ATP:ADP antiporter
LQIAIVPLLLRFVPLSAIHIGIPLMHLVLFSISLALPGFAPVAAAYLVFKAVDYSLFKAAKELLYIPLPFDSRYRAKEWIDSLGYRTGKGLGGMLALVMTRSAAGFGIPAAAVLAFAALGAWLGSAVVWFGKKRPG